MKPTLSICIPTLNRPDMLLQSLRSIFLHSSLRDKLEICISNNASRVDYSAVEALLNSCAPEWTINYVRHSARLPLDENHHYVKRLATADYIFFLGDDDFFLRDEIPKLLALITQTKPNLAIFNGFKVNEFNEYLGTLFTLPSRAYESIETAFSELWDKGSFGAVLVRREMLADEDFQKLYGTDHAYGCYWISLFRVHERGEQLKITVPDFPCVAVRCAQKNYNHIEVYFKTIPYEFSIRRQLVKLESLRQLIDEHESSFEKFQSSPRFLCHLRSFGNDLLIIEKLNPTFYVKHRRIIRFAQWFGLSRPYRLLIHLYRLIIKSAARRGDKLSTSRIAYKLSSAAHQSPE